LSDTGMIPEEDFDEDDETYGEDGCYRPGDIAIEQLHWLAKYDPYLMQGHAPAIYTMLEKLQLKAFIPLDNWRIVMGAPPPTSRSDRTRRP
jgi:hypothetical protein